MTAVMQGVRILEVAEHTFVPAASALLADWGAEVIKIEHVAARRRDARARVHRRRGRARRRPRAARALEPRQAEPRASTSRRRRDSTSSTSSPPRATSSSPTSCRASAPSSRSTSTRSAPTTRDIIYVRGTGQGERGPDADKGSYDSLAFWARAGVAIGAKRPEYDLVPVPPAPGFGDSIGAMTIAGGIMGALFHRERTGEATIVDVSLLGVGLWAMGQAMALSLRARHALGAAAGRPARRQPADAELRHGGRPHRSRSPACRPAEYWPGLCEVIGRPELATDPRFADHASLMAKTRRGRRRPDRGVRVGDARRVARPPRRLRRPVGGRAGHARGGRRPADGGQRLPRRTATPRPGIPSSWSAAPVQYDEEPADPGRAPEFNEHGDAILAELGLDWDAIVDLKVRGVVA